MRVSERIQRRMEAQERLLAAEQDRLAQQRMRDQQMARYDDGSYYPSYYAPGPYTNQPFRFRNTEPPFFEIGTHKNRFTPPPKRSHTARVRAASSAHQQCPEVVDVGEGRPRHHQVAEGAEEAVGVVCRRAWRAARARAPRARARVLGVTKAPAFSSLPSMPSVSAASTCTSGAPCSATGAAEQELAGAAAPARGAGPHRDRRLSRLRGTYARPLERLAAPRDLPRQRRVDLADLARFALDLVAEDVRLDARGARRGGGPPRASVAAWR
jgi:hypothetical protein